jgi:hypothetical protein
MVDNSNDVFFSGSLGSISGFTKSADPTDSGIIAAGWSLGELLEFFTNKRDVNFPNDDFVRRVNELIKTHTDDFNNPHNVTLEQVAHNFVTQIIGSVTSGSAPKMPPFFSYDSTCPLPLNDIFPATYSNANMYRMSDAGTYIDASSEVYVLGVDHVTNKPGLPLFPPFANTVPDNWYVAGGIPRSTIIQSAINPTPGFPFVLHMLSETEAMGSFGVTIPTPYPTDSIATFTFFAKTILTGGSILISQVSSPDDVLTVNLTDGTFEVSSDEIVAETFVYPSGIIRVSFTYKVKSGNATAVQVLHRNESELSTDREGSFGRQLFLFANPTSVLAPINHPILINRSLPAATTVFNAKIGEFVSEQSLDRLMITLNLNLYPMLEGAISTEALIVSFGSVSVTRSFNRINFKLTGVTIFSSLILPGSNVVTISYAPDRVIFKDFESDRKEVPGAFPPIPVTSLTIGQFSGYLQDIALYAASDEDRCVEFLTNG